MIKFKKRKKEKGSVLIFTMFVVVITLITGIGLVTVSISGRRSTLSSGKSVNSFQIADSGLEAALSEVKSADPTDSLDSVFSCNSDDEFREPNGEGEFLVTFWDDSGSQLDCSSSTMDDIESMKSTGIYRNITRSVETNFINP
jgi:hypothetical protein